MADPEPKPLSASTCGTFGGVTLCERDALRETLRILEARHAAALALCDEWDWEAAKAEAATPRSPARVRELAARDIRRLLIADAVNANEEGST